MDNTLVFIHGLESTAQGNKAQYFRQYFPQIIIEDYRGDFDTRMRKLYRVLTGKHNFVIVGSSIGGLMAAKYALENEDKMKKLVLIAPAINLKEFPSKIEKKLQIPVVIYHGKHDDVVDPYIVKAVAERTFANLDHHLVDDDHTCSKIFPQLDWKNILDAP
jgi:pimeloyl-ACP methyl ester carboxylesterase